MCARKHTVQTFPAALVTRYMRLVTETQFARYFGSTGLIPKPDDFYLGVQRLPTRQSIALDNATVALKRFCSGKKSNHEWRKLNHRLPSPLLLVLFRLFFAHCARSNIPTYFIVPSAKSFFRHLVSPLALASASDRFRASPCSPDETVHQKLHFPSADSLSSSGGSTSSVI